MAALPWVQILLAVWLTGALATSARLVWRRLRLRRLLGAREPVSDPTLDDILLRLRRRSGFTAPVRLTLSNRIPGPVAVGRHEICIPERVLTDLSPEQQESVLAHELAHLVRNDPGWLVWTGVIESVFFFQPLNRMARRRMQEAAEYLCDDWAVHHTGRGLTLAKCLAEVAGWVTQRPRPRPQPKPAMTQGGSPLVRRVERLLSPRQGTPRAHWALRAVATVSLVAMVLAFAPGVTPWSQVRTVETVSAVAELHEAVDEIHANRQAYEPIELHLLQPANNYFTAAPGHRVSDSEFLVTTAQAPVALATDDHKTYLINLPGTDHLIVWEDRRPVQQTEPLTRRVVIDARRPESDWEDRLDQVLDRASQIVEQLVEPELESLVEEWDRTVEPELEALEEELDAQFSPQLRVLTERLSRFRTEQIRSLEIRIDTQIKPRVQALERDLELQISRHATDPQTQLRIRSRLERELRHLEVQMDQVVRPQVDRIRVQMREQIRPGLRDLRIQMRTRGSQERLQRLETEEIAPRIDAATASARYMRWAWS